MIEIIDLIKEFFKDKINNENMILLYHNISKIIVNQNLDVDKLEKEISNIFGISINFSKRNLVVIRDFYHIYNNINNDMLKINWYIYFYLIKINDKVLINQYLEVCILKHFTSKMFKKYLNNRNKNISYEEENNYLLEELEKLKKFYNDDYDIIDEEVMI